MEARAVNKVSPNCLPRKRAVIAHGAQSQISVTLMLLYVGLLTFGVTVEKKSMDRHLLVSCFLWSQYCKGGHSSFSSL